MAHSVRQRLLAGEIRKAPGVCGDIVNGSEVILFTDDEKILTAIEVCVLLVVAV